MMKSFIISLATKLTIPVFLQSCASCPYITTHHNNFSFIPLFLNAHPSHTHSPNPTYLSPLTPSHTWCSCISTLILFSIYQKDTYCFGPRETPVSTQAEQPRGRCSRTFFSLWRGQFLEGDGTGCALAREATARRPCCHPRLPCFQTVGGKVCKVFRLSIS